ncbi:MAG: hypothetical protein A2889_05240 [Nitrospinae bacterium RIFCSPLOWO2_01_FULL_39_10]|nr:MAG: hypothetical protein A2889_05240 [Nitrospinae bacterium RIFCSPLOWO2_01_FULL_39_10]
MKTASKVRKQFILDPAKVEAVKKITKARTDTEAINKALDIVIENTRIEKMLMAIKGKGDIKDVYNRVSN